MQFTNCCEDLTDSYDTSSARLIQVCYFLFASFFQDSDILNARAIRKGHFYYYRNFWAWSFRAKSLQSRQELPTTQI